MEPTEQDIIKSITKEYELAKEIGTVIQYSATATKDYFIKNEKPIIKKGEEFRILISRKDITRNKIILKDKITNIELNKKETIKSIMENTRRNSEKKQIIEQIKSAINQYGSDFVDLMIMKDNKTLQCIYHSRNNSFPIGEEIKIEQNIKSSELKEICDAYKIALIEE